MKHALTLCAVGALLAGCTEVANNYPRLLPTDQLLAEPALPAHAPDAAASPAAVEAHAESRADALRRRADALRGPVIEPDVRDRFRKE